MKFKFTAGSVNKPNEYARWLSTDGNYSIQRFLYKTPRGGGIAVPSDPYYCVYSIRDGSKNIGTAPDFNTVRNIANHDDIKKYSPIYA